MLCVHSHVCGTYPSSLFAQMDGRVKTTVPLCLHCCQTSPKRSVCDEKERIDLEEKHNFTLSLFLAPSSRSFFFFFLVPQTPVSPVISSSCFTPSLLYFFLMPCLSLVSFGDPRLQRWCHVAQCASLWDILNGGTVTASHHSSQPQSDGWSKRTKGNEGGANLSCRRFVKALETPKPSKIIE